MFLFANEMRHWHIYFPRIIIKRYAGKENSRSGEESKASG
jgi:hypothetical protein